MNQNNPSSWQPSASLKYLKARADLYREIRHFFDERNVLEVDTPILSKAATVDPAIESLSTQVFNRDCYLQTSPEFFLKRLLAAESGDVYSLAKAFREGEAGRKHQPEFTLLEWYRVGWNEHQLMDEVVHLIKQFFVDVGIKKNSYRQLFLDCVQLDPFLCSVEELKLLAKQSISIEAEDSNRDFWLDLIMTHIIEPELSEHLWIVYDYPASQAALAQIHKDDVGNSVARRFEVYFKGIELANGYFELRDAQEQQQRFELDLDYRRQHQLPEYPYDKKLVEALRSGMPACAGVALGVDRLLMLILGEDDIRRVVSFAFE